jgi:hypothetical protein
MYTGIERLLCRTYRYNIILSYTERGALRWQEGRGGTSTRVYNSPTRRTGPPRSTYNIIYIHTHTQVYYYYITTT